MFTLSLPSETNGQKKNPSIIDMANAAYSLTPSIATATASGSGGGGGGGGGGRSKSRSRNNSTSSTNLDDRLDAARAMLGISPCSVTDISVGSIMGGRGGTNGKQKQASTAMARATSSTSSSSSSRNSGNEIEGSDCDCDCDSDSYSHLHSHSRGRPRSNSAGLDALAFFATQEQEAAVAVAVAATMETATTTTTTAATVQTTTVTVPYSSISLVAHAAVTSSDDDDSETMPPPPPRTTVTRMTRRRRSVSNPEGMDKWELPMDYNYNDNSQSQTMRRLRLVLPTSILEEEIAEANAAVIAKEKSTASASALAASFLSENDDNNNRNYNKNKNNNWGVGSHERSHLLPLVEEEETLSHDQLLRRARSRLLEDLSQSSITGEKGVLTLPHSLRKYKEVYNKNGRIGIYTPAERAAIIARFQSKRTRRVWNKKIRYNCRKNLADRRLRVKGRFVKRSHTTTVVVRKTPQTPKALCSTTKGKGDGNGNCGSTTATDTDTFAAILSIPEDAEIGQSDENDTEMPDVSDPDAGFCPTDEQPYRRLRRHTIT